MEFIHDNIMTLILHTADIKYRYSQGRHLGYLLQGMSMHT